MALVQTTTQAIRHELVGLGGVVERNWYLVKRYIWWELAFFLWTAANTLTIVFIAEGVGLSAEAEELAERVGILDRGRLLALEPAGELRQRYGGDTLEEAFFAATGRSFEEEEAEVAV
ncbi:MAG TPA: hypothetical protein VK278_02195 [Gaiellaceae bacterium]|nr:hypothetical protein [Gaiellaceae bacterium]